MVRFTRSICIALVLVAQTSASNKWFSLWPVASDRFEENNKVTEDLANRPGIGKDNFMKSESPTLGVMYWFAKLSDEDVKHYDSDEVPGVVYVADVVKLNGPPETFAAVRRGPSLTKRSMTSQVPAAKHLKTISTPRGTSWEKQDGYHYDDTAGQGARIYIIDSGLKKEHKEFTDYKINWMYAGPYAENVEDDSDRDDQYSPPHGTAMSSVALGQEQGVAKKASLTIVRCDIYHKDVSKGFDRSTFAPETWIDGLKQVYDELKSTSKNGEDPKSVINMSWGVAKHLLDDDYDKVIRNTFANLLKSIDNLNAVMLASSGQPAFGRPVVDTWPQMLAESQVPNLIVVGGIEDDGSVDESTRVAPYVKVSANSVEVDVADARNGEYGHQDGTSPACAMTAGLVAYFIGLGNTGPVARKLLYDNAYPRLPNGKGPNVPWNGYDPKKAEAAASPFPTPSCKPEAFGGYDGDKAIDALEDFCTFYTRTITPGSVPVSQVYDSGPGREVPIRLSVAWDAGDPGQICPSSQSPTQNEGRDCNTIFHSIVDCDNFAGGSVRWNCGYWSLGFDGEPNVPPTTTADPATEIPFPTPT